MNASATHLINFSENSDPAPLKIISYLSFLHSLYVLSCIWLRFRGMIFANSLAGIYQVDKLQEHLDVPT